MTRRLLIAVAWLALVPARPLWADDDDLATLLMWATVKISHEKTTGTGFILCRPDPRQFAQRPFILVTAGHVFANIPGDTAIVFFRSKESEGVYRKQPVRILIRKDGKPRWTAHPTEDVAVLPVEPPEGADLPKLDVSLLASEQDLRHYHIHPGDMLGCLGYPHRVEANAAGFPILRQGALASFPILPTKANKTFLLSANTFEGDSGAPVFLAEAQRRLPGQEKPAEVRLIVGLMRAQMFLDEDVRMLYGMTKVRHRLGLGIVIPAPFIRETVDRLR